MRCMVDFVMFYVSSSLNCQPASGQKAHRNLTDQAILVVVGIWIDDLAQTT